MTLLLSLVLAFSCSCPERLSVDEELKQSKEVFVGTVERVDMPDWDDSTGNIGLQNYVFKVRTSWRSYAPTITVSVRPLSDCAYTFIVGKTYLVNTRGDPTDQALSMGTMCSRTAPLEHAAEDIAELGEPVREFED